MGVLGNDPDLGLGQRLVLDGDDPEPVGLDDVAVDVHGSASSSGSKTCSKNSRASLRTLGGGWLTMSSAAE